MSLLPVETAILHNLSIRFHEPSIIWQRQAKSWREDHVHMRAYIRFQTQTLLRIPLLPEVHPYHFSKENNVFPLRSALLHSRLFLIPYMQSPFLSIVLSQKQLFPAESYPIQDVCANIFSIS